MFYSNRWYALVQTIKNLFLYQTSAKITKFSLKLMERCFRVKPQLMITEFEFYMWHILPSYVVFDQKDKDMAI